MGIANIKKDDTIYPISPLVFEDTDRIVGNIGEKDLISKRYHFTGDQFSISNYHSELSISLSTPSITEGQRTQILDNIILITYVHYVTTTGDMVNIRTNTHFEYSSGILQIDPASDGYWSLPSGTMDTTNSYMDILIITTQPEV